MRVFLLAAAIAAAAGAFAVSPAEAGVHIGVSIGRTWGHGHWVHDRHHGRLGWYWVVGPRYYWYERPDTIVVQPTPPVVIQSAPQQPMTPPPPPPPSPVLYYCKATGTHYPETMTCPGGWETRTAETPPVPAPAQERE